MKSTNLELQSVDIWRGWIRISVEFGVKEKADWENWWTGTAALGIYCALGVRITKQTQNWLRIAGKNWSGGKIRE